MRSEAFGSEVVVWRAGTLLGLAFSLWLVLPAQQSHWNNLQRKYSASIVVLASSENLDRGLSCGFFISNKGQMAAVIPEPARQQVLLARRADGSFIKTRVLRSNPQLRLAILQASISASQPFRLGDSSKVKVGDAAGAFGYTTAGRLVIQPVTIAKIQRTPDGVKVFHLMPPPESFLSGVPVINRRGEVIGIVTRVADKPPACALPVGYLRNFPAPRPSGNPSPPPTSTVQESPLWQKFQPVVQAARQIADLGARTEALATLARIAMQSGFSDKAQILLQEAIDTANKLQDIEECSFALKRVVLQLGQQNRWQEAVQLVAQIPDWLQKATVLRELSQQAARVGQPEQALTIAHQIEDPHHRCAALVTAAVVFYRQEPPRPHHPEEEPDKSPESSEPPESASPTEPAPVPRWVELLEEARRIAQQVASERLRIDSMATVAAGMMATGALEAGQALLEEARQLAQQLDALSAESAHHDMVMALLEYDHHEKALPLIEQLPAGRRDTAFVRLVEGLIRQGLIDQVETVIPRIRDRQKQARARLLLIRHLIQSRQLERLASVMETLPASLERVQALTGLALNAYREGQAEQAMQHLQQAEEATKRLSDPRQHPEAIATVAAAYAQNGDLDRAESLFQEAITAAQRLGEPWTSSLLAKILLMKADAIHASARSTPPAPSLSNKP